MLLTLLRSQQVAPPARKTTDGPWRKLSGEYPKPRARREEIPALDPARFPFPPAPVIAPAPVEVVQLQDMRVTLELDSPFRDVILGDLAPIERPKPRPLTDEEAIALLLAL